MRIILALPKLLPPTVAIFLFAGMSRASAQQCMLQPPPQLSGFAAQRWLGNTYRSMNCFAQAHAAYAQMQKDAMALPDSDANKATIIMWTPYYQELVTGMEAWQRGDFDTAQAAFADVAQSTGPGEMTVPAATALGDSMVQHFNDKYTSAVQSTVMTWAGGWKVEYYTTLIGLNLVNANGRISALQSLLDSDLPLEARLPDEVILLDALSHVGRLVEAELLARNIEQDIGLKGWSLDLRAYYLQTCYELASREQAAGWQDASPRASIYLNAWRQLNVPR